MQKLNFWVPLQEPNGTPLSVRRFTYPPPPPRVSFCKLYIQIKFGLFRKMSNFALSFGLWSLVYLFWKFSDCDWKMLDLLKINLVEAQDKSILLRRSHHYRNQKILLSSSSFFSCKQKQSTRERIILPAFTQI